MIRKLLKWIFRIVLLLVLLVVAVLVFKDSLVKFFAEWQLRNETGLEVKIGRFEVGLVSPVIRIENFKLYNTAAFGGSTFVDIPEIYVQYDRVALASGKFHAKLVRFNLAEVNIVRNETGQTNIVVLSKRIEKNSRHKKLKAPDFTGIDTLNLTLGKARFMDLKSPANSYEFNFRIQNAVAKNVKSERDLTGVVLLALIRNSWGHAETPRGGVNSFLRAPSAAAEKAKQFLEFFSPAPKPK